MATAKKLPSGSWRVQVLAGYDASGKKIQKSFTAPTKWEAEKMADEYKRYKKEKPTDKQVGKIIDEYIEIKSNVLSPTTIRGYKAIRATRLQSIMGEKLSRLTATDIQRPHSPQELALMATTPTETACQTSGRLQTVSIPMSTTPIATTSTPAAIILTSKSMPTLSLRTSSSLSVRMP